MAPETTQSLRFPMKLLGLWQSAWQVWWSSLPRLQRIGPIAITLIYIGSLVALGGLRGDHFTVSAVFLTLSYGGPLARRILKFVLPLILTGVVYDSQRFYSDYIRGAIRVSEPYLFDKTFFGISTPQGLLTPNEWLQLHTSPVLDFFTGLAYIIFIGVFVSIAAYWSFYKSRVGTFKVPAWKLKNDAPKVMWAFFWVNVVGYTTYYWYPAAPPWYVALHGLGPALMDTPANSAGCIRFDQLLGTNFFGQFYGRSADVFGAVPSLHVAYPLQTIYYAFKFGSMRVFSMLFFLLMCFAAVYLNHHYILDLIWGWAYALLICLVVDFWWELRKKSSGTI